MKLSVLDVEGSIEQTIELAPHAESLGYARYWIAEHQPQPTPILIASLVAGVTQSIRVGTAGILFHYYPPLRTAHDFHFLERAYEGRIDAGFCGGLHPGLPPVELDGRDLATLLEKYPERVARLVAHLRNTPANPAYDRETAWTGALDDPPEIWSLGGGAKSADLAAAHGLYYGYSLLYGTSVDAVACVQRYRERFVPDRCQPRPYVAIAVCGVCAETDEAARSIAAKLSGAFFTARIVGSAKACAADLRALRDRYDADEIVFADLCTGLDARKRCYELLADAIRS